MSDVVTIGGGNVPDLQAIAHANNEQARAEEIQRKIMSANLAANVLGSTTPSGLYVNEICEAFDAFLTVD